MLIDAILQRILHSSTEELVRAVIITCCIIGVLASLIGPAFFQLLEWLYGKTRKGRAARRREQNAELQRKYEGVCAELRESQEDNARLVAENITLVGLLREECVHDRDWTMRTRRALDERKVAGA